MTHQVQNLNQNVEEKKTCTHYVFLSPLQYKEQMYIIKYFLILVGIVFEKLQKNNLDSEKQPHFSS